MFRILMYSAGLTAICVVLKSTVLSYIAIRGATPDLTLIVIVYLSNKNGTMVGQINGFIAGFFEDLLSTAPLGFNALVKTILGFIYGVTKGNIFLDPIFMPILLVTVGLLLKGIFALIIASVFGVLSFKSLFATQGFWIQIGYTALVSPFIFGLLNLIKPLQKNNREMLG